MPTGVGSCSQVRPYRELPAHDGREVMQSSRAVVARKFLSVGIMWRDG